MFKRLCLTAFLACAVTPAFGYWTQYKPRANAPWPEDQGWERITWYGGAERKIENGALVLDSTASGAIVDYYRMIEPGMIHAQPGRPFMIEWREVVDYGTFVGQSTVTVFSDDEWIVDFWITTDRIYNANNYPEYAPFQAGWHTFRMTTPDMRSWTLSIDGAPSLAGSFLESSWTSEVSWGDGAQGGVSLTRWAYVAFGTGPEPSVMQSFGIAPEPGAVLAVLLVLVPVLRTSRRGPAGF